MPDCLTCEYFRHKKCEGFGVRCFEIDTITGTIIDPITKLNIKEKENGDSK